VGKPGKNQPKDRMICFCYSVSESTIIKAIEDGAETLMDIRRNTYANTGCAGCANEVKKILNKHVPRVQAAKAKPQEPPKEENG
jgi:NAD(P)H-nitrite reductase large subunit